MSNISEKDKESLEEAKKVKEEAEKLQISANDLYLEAAMLEQNENFASDKKIQKEYKKKQKNAQTTEINASEKFEEANKIQIEIYQKYIDDFWKDFGGDESVLTNARLIEETSKEYFIRASTARDEAKRLDNQTEKFLKLSEAYEYELIGLEKLQSAYNIYKNWPDADDNEISDDNIDFQISDIYVDEEATGQETISDTPGQALPAQSTQTGTKENINLQNPETGITELTNEPVDIKTNQETSENIHSDVIEVSPEQAEKILRYMQQNDDTVYYLANEIEGYNMASIQKFWDDYKNLEFKDEPQQTLMAESEKSKENTTPIRTNNIVPENTDSKNISVSSNKPEITTNKTVGEKDETGEVEIGRVTETVVPDPDSKIIYRIQIAAEKAPLSQNMLQKLFNAKHKIAMVNEDSWYKYSIGEFDSFAEADEFRKTLDRDDAFVVAYRDAINVQYVEKEKTKKTTTVVAKAEQLPEPGSENVIFVVQIAASKKTMDEAGLKRIYKGELPIKSRFEDNWFKYQIGHTNSYLDIKQVKNNVDVKGAFIVAYDGDTKLKLWQAIRNVHPSNDQIAFVVQIAASKIRLSDEKLNSIFSGSDHIIEIYEEGWYKYHIVCGNTYDAARRFKNLWGIKNSFIVAYKNNKKIDIRQAIEETSN